jgi:hypothetical protein
MYVLVPDKNAKREKLMNIDSRYKLSLTNTISAMTGAGSGHRKDKLSGRGQQYPVCIGGKRHRPPEERRRDRRI